MNEKWRKLRRLKMRFPATSPDAMEDKNSLEMDS